MSKSMKERERKEQEHKKIVMMKMMMTAQSIHRDDI